MARSISERINILEKIGAPELFSNLNNGIKAPGIYKWKYQEPSTFNDLTTEYPDNMPFENDLIPLWETNGDYIVAYVAQDEPKIIKYYFEDSAEEFEIIGSSILDAVEHILKFEFVEGEAVKSDFFELAALLKHPNPHQIYKKLVAEYGE